MKRELGLLAGTPFAKMTGSGNDFVFLDIRDAALATVKEPQVIRAICNRHNGIGADGLVVLERVIGPVNPDNAGAAPLGTGQSEATSVRIHFFNSDGTVADLCGNATLCATALAAELGMASAAGMTLHTQAGVVASRLLEGMPEIDLQPVSNWTLDADVELAPQEHRVGYVIIGVPHLVVLCDDADSADLEGRGPKLRRHPSTGEAGANVNWVSKRPDGSWRYRTFERGVEGETLACGTGAVASAILLHTWGMASATVNLIASSGRAVTVQLAPVQNGYRPTLRGEGRVVFRGHINDLRI